VVLTVPWPRCCPPSPGRAGFTAAAQPVAHLYDPCRMLGLLIDSVPEGRFNQLEPLWQVLYEHQIALTPHLRDRQVPFDRAWQTRRQIEGEWLRTEPRSFVLAAQVDDRYVGYAFVRVRSGAGFAASWVASDPLAELATLVVLPELQGQGVGSALIDAVEVRLGALGVEDMVIGVITTNTAAMRLYERRGAVPFVTEFIQRVQTQSADAACSAIES
jgi:ribosomal protein S18 acetylase RimI-like enzyme